jgi:hypothetical protein
MPRITIICDSCNKDCFGGCDNEFAIITATWGYDSNKDLVNHNLHLCEDCFDKAIEFLKRTNPNRPSPDPFDGRWYGPPVIAGQPVK